MGRLRCNAGHMVAVVNRDTGELREAQVFVAVLGASNYTYAEATWTQTLPDWCASHVRAFEFFGGSTELLIPDDVAAVSRPADIAGGARVQGHIMKALGFVTIFSPIHWRGGCHVGTVFPQARYG